MTDLRTLLATTAGNVESLPADLVESDLARGRQALRRRRLGVSSSLATAAAIGALAITTTAGGTDPGSSRTQPDTTAGSRAATGSFEPVALVAYHGQQPEGFSVARKPKGYQVSQSNAGVLTFAPVGSAAAARADDFVGKIAISLSDATPAPGDGAGDVVTVAGRRGFIFSNEDEGGRPDGVRTLYVEQPSGAYLTVQVWSGLGWDTDRITRFAEGIGVTDDAITSVG